MFLPKLHDLVYEVSKAPPRLHTGKEKFIDGTVVLMMIILMIYNSKDVYLVLPTFNKLILQKLNLHSL